MTPHDPFEEGEQTLIRPDHHHHEDPEEPGDELEPEEAEENQGTSERSKVGMRGELLFKGTSKSETKSNMWRQEQSSLVKQGKNAMMSSISPTEEQPSSKAKRVHALGHGLSPRQEKSKKALSDSPTRPMSDGITMGASSKYDKLMMSMGTQKGVASSNTRLQPQSTSSSLSLTPMH